ncbi:MAG: PQ-loop repeat-containing protein [Verrucomicrobiae bacterium]|nr:PQ-loop repeat-containing protein [Verrucomicrobiae bacterium]
MTAEQFFGTGAMVLGFVGGCIGLPVQLLKNWQRKSVEGLSLTFWVILYTNVWFWLLYAFSKVQTDWYLVVANVPGLVFISVLLGQFAWYRDGRARSARDDGPRE